MKPYGFVITNAGQRLIAKLAAGKKLALSRVVVGSGSADEGDNIRELTDLVMPVAEAASSLPVYNGSTVQMQVEYRSDMNGGLQQGFWLNEFGIFAIDPDDGEILLYYGTLGDYPQYVTPSDHGVDVRRFPVCIFIGEGKGVTVQYNCSSFMTAEDMKEYVTAEVMPDIEGNIRRLISEHNLDSAAHSTLWKRIAAVEARIAALELMVSTDVKANQFAVQFSTLDDVNADGVWDSTNGNICF